MRSKQLGLILMLFVCGAKVFAQSYKDFISPKNFAPPSPEAVALNRYGEIPVDLSSGVPSINIPVYEIKSRKLSLPISLSYHASGIKLQDVSTPVGLGWVLNADGQISRSIVGIADESSAGFLNRTYKNRNYYVDKVYNSSDLSDLNLLSNGTWDPQSDIYNFNFNGIAGKFVYDTNHAIQYLPVDRQLNFTRASNLFTVRDDQGLFYEFIVTDTTATQGGGATGITTWHMTRMISADKTDTITFQYFAANALADTMKSNSYSVKAPRVPENMCQLANPQYAYNDQWTYLNYTRKLIQKIIFANGYVKFEYVADRQDGVPERLSKIKVYDNDDNLIKEVQLIQGYFGLPPNARMKLDKLVFTGSDTTNKSFYRFDYNQEYTMPSIRSAEMDYWGYYNGNQSTRLLPNKFENDLTNYFNNVGYGSGANNIIQDYAQHAADRSVLNPSFTQAYSLTTITYPTGGATKFEYENNKINETLNSSVTVGGLRIRKISTIDPASQVTSIKTYKYDSGFVARVIPADFSYDRETVIFYPNSGACCYSTDHYINANPVNGIKYYNSSPVMYTKVTEFLGDTIANIGKTEYLYEFEGDSLYSADYLKKYWNFSTDKSWSRGSLLGTRQYKNVNGTYSIVKEVKNYYATKGAKLVKVGQICEQLTDVLGNSLEGYLVMVVQNPSAYHAQHKYLLTHFDYIDVVIPFGVKKLIKTEEVDYLNNTVTQKQEIAYESAYHLYPTRKITFRSEGDSMIEVTKYPQDKASMSNLSSSAAAALDSMIANNIRMLPAETETYRNTQLLVKNRSEYKSWGNKGLYEEYASMQVRQNAMERRMQFKTYDDKGNITSLSKVNDHDISYIWDYNKSLPIAQVINASPSNIAYTSFESDGSGNWSFSGKPSADNTSPSGSKVYTLSGGSITRAGLGNISYTVSYWSKNGVQNVNGTAAVTGRSVNGWTYFEHTVINPGAGVIAVSGTGTVDELRLYPKGAFMTTYLHLPLVGVSEQVDPNNRMTFYSYDGLSRLILVRDDNKNILKKYCYSYAGQSGDCTVSNAPIWRNLGLYRCVLNVNNNNTGEQQKQEIDSNPYSATYNQTRWVTNGFNLSACPSCTTGNCTGVGYKCVNGTCELGVKVYTSYVYDSISNQCVATYHYEWSDGSWSSNDFETSLGICPSDQ